MNNHLSVFHRSARLILAALVLLTMLLTGSTPARAAGLTVTTLDDELNADGDCSLREAITAANTDTAVDACTAGAGADSISVPAGTITLGSQLPAVTTTLTIAGSGAANTILQANANPNTATYRVLQVTSSGNLTLDGLTVRNGRALLDVGGGILNVGGTLTVTNSTFSGNSAAIGGALHNNGIATVTNSTFAGNSAIRGGAIRHSAGGADVLSVINSTFSGNSATDNTAGIANDTAVNTFHMSNTIIANSLSGGDCNTAPATNVNNLIEDGSCSPALSGDPNLGPLQDNGGPTQTMALLSGSPAIDAGDDTACPATDQRGITRPQGSHCDIGAFELEQTADTTPPTITITTPAESATYLLGQTINADYVCQDETGGSGLASCVGDVPTGSPLDTSTVGARTFTVNATDNAGNASSASVSYDVIYNFSGFFSPVDNLPVLNTVKAGKAIPVKFSLGGDQGLDIFAAGYPKVQQIACTSSAPGDAIEETVSSGGSGLQYDSATQIYTYVLKTQKNWAGTCRQLIVRLADGTDHIANFMFK